MFCPNGKKYRPFLLLLFCPNEIKTGGNLPIFLPEEYSTEDEYWECEHASVEAALARWIFMLRVFFE